MFDHYNMYKITLQRRLPSVYFCHRAAASVCTRAYLGTVHQLVCALQLLLLLLCCCCSAVAPDEPILLYTGLNSTLEQKKSTKITTVGTCQPPSTCVTVYAQFMSTELFILALQSVILLRKACQ
jgi:hypothetical protein